MRKTFKYRLYPSKTQQRKLDVTLETCRRWWNDLLDERKTAWEERQESVGKIAQLQRVKQHKISNPWAAEIHSHVLQTVVADLDRAFQAFFRRLKAGEKAGYPRFKGRNRFHSFGLNELGNGFRLDGRRLKVSGIGRMAVRWHRPIEGTIKTLRLSRKVGHWYASFSVEYMPQPLPATGREVGIDVGIKSLLTLSDGAAVPPQNWYRSEQRKLRVL